MDSSIANNFAMSACESTRQLVLDHALSTSDLARLNQALAHLQSCGECRAAIADFDQLRELIGVDPIGVDRIGVDPIIAGESSQSDWVHRSIKAMPSQTRRNHFWIPLSIGLAACAALCFAFVGYRFGLQPATPAIASQTSTEFTPISPADVSNRARAFTQVNKAFDNRAGWMLVSNSDSDVGLDAEPSTASGMILLRLTVTRHMATATANQSQEIVSSADLAILPGRTAQVSLPFTQDRVLRYEIEVGSGNPTHLGLTAELLPRAGRSAHPEMSKPLAAISTSLDLRSGGSAPAGSFVTGAAGYDITVGFATADLAGAQQ
jgi:hypothetical protein